MGILIIESAAELQAELRGLLAAGGFHELFFSDSLAEALIQLGLPAGEATINPELILMNLKTSQGSTIAAYRELKSSEQFKAVPVLIIVDTADAAELEEAIAAGAADFITLPLNKFILLARVRAALKFKLEMERHRAREKQLEEISNLLEEVCRKVLRSSGIDGLTGVSNRKHFNEMIDKEWRRAIRSALPLSLIMVDVDYFKIYNDTFGHLAGDECLKKVALTLNESLNRAGDLVARYGGEEFSVILPNTPREGALLVAEKMRANVAALALDHPNSKIDKFVTISLGTTSIIPKHNLQLSDFIQAADQALYKAKESGRNCVIHSETFLPEETTKN